MSETNGDVKIRVIDSDKLIKAINEGSCDINLSAIMALGAVMLDTKKGEKSKQLSLTQPESTRTFVELVVEYLDPEICPYKEYKGKPYYSIKYIENGETHVGYGTYNPEVLSQYLNDCFIPSAQPEIVKCRDCKHRVENKHYGEPGYIKLKAMCELDTGDPFELGRNAEDDEWFCADAERRTDERSD